MGKSLIIKNADFSAVAVYTEFTTDFPYIVNLAGLSDQTYSLNGAAWGSHTYNKHIVMQVPDNATIVKITPQQTEYGTTKALGIYGLLTTYNPGANNTLYYASGYSKHVSMTASNSSTGDKLGSGERTISLPANCKFIVFTTVIYRNDTAYTNNDPWDYRPIKVEFDTTSE